MSYFQVEISSRTQSQEKHVHPREGRERMKNEKSKKVEDKSPATTCVEAKDRNEVLKPTSSEDVEKYNTVDRAEGCNPGRGREAGHWVSWSGTCWWPWEGQFGTNGYRDLGVSRRQDPKADLTF